MTLNDFLKQVGEAVVDAAHQCSMQATARLMEHLDKEGKPKMISVKMTDSLNVEVPTITLVPQSVLLPEEVEIEMSSDILEKDDVGKNGNVGITFRQMGEENEGASRIKVKVTLTRQKKLEALEQLKDGLVEILHKHIKGHS